MARWVGVCCILNFILKTRRDNWQRFFQNAFWHSKKMGCAAVRRNAVRRTAVIFGFKTLEISNGFIHGGLLLGSHTEGQRSVFFCFLACFYLDDGFL